MEKLPCLVGLGFTVSMNKRLEIDEVEDTFITNKLLLELNTIKERSNGVYTYQDVLNWISSLSDTDWLLEIPETKKPHNNDTEKISNIKSKKRETIDLKHRNNSNTRREANRKLIFKLQKCEKQLSQTERKLKISQTQNKINKKRYIQVFKFLRKRRTETDLCIMELLNRHVLFDRVDIVIKSVLSLCKLKAKDETLPKKDYVLSVNVRRLAISQAYIAETCTEGNRTLHTDETRKHGQSYGVFITSNENQEPYLLGLKHLSSKASKTVLETLEEILKEIEDRTQYLQNENPPSLAYNILKNISNTMSDRAPTEKSFQQLLQDYRTTLLKENMDNFNELSEPDQILITKMNNFFCGLHLLVNIADLICSIFKEWEQTVMNKEVIGESAIIKTVREVCKAFVPGVDNKKWSITRAKNIPVKNQR
ncbi:unnamed protein product [Mytilus coruscus]|uniref:Uncharacterized protein n=1 Tax=Mytilus coruscus TaxID=42192 RepID=A0A6J8CAC9_MYTCO|nr:unnamed protein product [Mytilus coruscus]